MASVTMTTAELGGDRPLLLPSLARRLLLVGRGAAAFAAITGAAVLVGYWMRSPTVVRLAPSLPPMYPNAALALVFGGAAALLVGGVSVWQRYVAAALSVGVTAIGAVGLLLHVTSAPSGWYEWLWPDEPFVAATTPTPGRPVAETCVGLVLVGVALVFVASDRWPRIAQSLALGGVAVGMTAVVGFLVGVDRAQLGGSFVTIGMALHTALGLAALALAALFSRPSVGILGLLGDAGAGGRLGRRLLLAAMAAPIALVTVNAVLGRTMSDSALASSILTVLQVAALGALVVVPIAAMERFEWQASLAARTTRRRSEAVGDDQLVIEALAAEVLSAPPEPPGWRLGFSQEPAEGFLAGDSQQLLIGDDGRFLIAIIDVAGHGTGPALDALRLRAELAALWQHRVELADIVGTLNLTLIQRATIASAVVLTVETETGRTEYINAGHPPPVRLAGRRLTTLDRTGLILGVTETTFEVASTTLEPTDLLVMYTDGIIEARNPELVELGPEALHETVRSRAAEGPQQVARACADAALEHTGGRLRDDALVVVLQRL